MPLVANNSTMRQKSVAASRYLAAVDCSNPNEAFATTQHTWSKDSPSPLSLSGTTTTASLSSSSRTPTPDRRMSHRSWRQPVSIANSPNIRGSPGVSEKDEIDTNGFPRISLFTTTTAPTASGACGDADTDGSDTRSSVKPHASDTSSTESATHMGPAPQSSKSWRKRLEGTERGAHKQSRGAVTSDSSWIKKKSAPRQFVRPKPESEPKPLTAESLRERAELNDLSYASTEAMENLTRMDEQSDAAGAATEVMTNRAAEPRQNNCRWMDEQADIAGAPTEVMTNRAIEPRQNNCRWIDEQADIAGAPTEVMTNLRRPSKENNGPSGEYLRSRSAQHRGYQIGIEPLVVHRPVETKSLFSSDSTDGTELLSHSEQLTPDVTASASSLSPTGRLGEFVKSDDIGRAVDIKASDSSFQSRSLTSSVGVEIGGRRMDGSWRIFGDKQANSASFSRGERRAFDRPLDNGANVEPFNGAMSDILEVEVTPVSKVRPALDTALSQSSSAWVTPLASSTRGRDCDPYPSDDVAAHEDAIQLLFSPDRVMHDVVPDSELMDLSGFGPPEINRTAAVDSAIAASEKSNVHEDNMPTQSKETVDDVAHSHVQTNRYSRTIMKQYIARHDKASSNSNTPTTTSAGTFMKGNQLDDRSGGASQQRTAVRPLEVENVTASSRSQFEGRDETIVPPQMETHKSRNSSLVRSRVEWLSRNAECTTQQAPRESTSRREVPQLEANNSRETAKLQVGHTERTEPWTTRSSRMRGSLIGEGEALSSTPTGEIHRMWNVKDQALASPKSSVSKIKSSFVPLARSDDRDNNVDVDVKRLRSRSGESCEKAESEGSVSRMRSMFEQNLSNSFSEKTRQRSYLRREATREEISKVEFDKRVRKPHAWASANAAKLETRGVGTTEAMPASMQSNEEQQAIQRQSAPSQGESSFLLDQARSDNSEAERPINSSVSSRRASCDLGRAEQTDTKAREQYRFLDSAIHENERRQRLTNRSAPTPEDGVKPCNAIPSVNPQNREFLDSRQVEPTAGHSSTLPGAPARPASALQMHKPFEATDDGDNEGYDDGVTLDLSIADVSCLTNPTCLRSEKGASFEEGSSRFSREMEPTEVEGRGPSEASSSQMSEAAAPLIALAMRAKFTNSSDDFGEFASKSFTDRLSRPKWIPLAEPIEETEGTLAPPAEPIEETKGNLNKNSDDVLDAAWDLTNIADRSFAINAGQAKSDPGGNPYSRLEAALWGSGERDSFDWQPFESSNFAENRSTRNGPTTNGGAVEQSKLAVRRGARSHSTSPKRIDRFQRTHLRNGVSGAEATGVPSISSRRSAKASQAMPLREPMEATLPPRSNPSSSRRVDSSKVINSRHALLLQKLRSLKEARLRRNTMFARNSQVESQDVGSSRPLLAYNNAGAIEDDGSVSTMSSTRFGGLNFDVCLDLD